MLTYMGLSYCSIMALTSNSPFKMSYFLILFSGFAFMILHDISGLSMFPYILLMMFLGGIILMFMIISSLFPNEKFHRSFNSPLMLLFVLFYYLDPISFQTSSMSEAFTSFSSGMNFYIIVLLISLYFFGFLSLISSSKMTLRSTECSFSSFL